MPCIPATDPKLAIRALEEALPPNEFAAVKSWLGCFFPFQLEWLLDFNRFSASVKSRQIGASFVAGADAALWALLGETTTIVSKGQRESDEVLDKAKNHLLALAELGSRWAVIEGKNSAIEIRAKSKGRVISLPASSGGRSFSGNMILDEFAYHDNPEKVWDSASGVVTQGHKLRVISTPNGVGNAFHSLITDEKEHDGYSIHTVPIERAIAEGMRIDMDACWKQARGNPKVFAQLFQCSFLDSNDQYIPTELIQNALVGHIPPIHGACYAGLDIGKNVDKTSLVIVCRDLRGVNWVLNIATKSRTKQQDIDDLVSLAFSEHFQCRKIAIDSTGLGGFPAEEIQSQWGRHRVELVSFTQNSKEELAGTLYENFAKNRIKIQQKEQALVKDLLSLRRIITVAGNVRYDAPRTAEGHADSAWALALALHVACVPINVRTEV